MYFLSSHLHLLYAYQIKLAVYVKRKKGVIAALSNRLLQQHLDKGTKSSLNSSSTFNLYSKVWIKFIHQRKALTKPSVTSSSAKGRIISFVTFINSDNKVLHLQISVSENGKLHALVCYCVTSGDACLGYWFVFFFFYQTCQCLSQFRVVLEYTLDDWSNSVAFVQVVYFS